MPGLIFCPSPAYDSFVSTATGLSPFEMCLRYQLPLFPSQEFGIAVPAVQDYLSSLAFVECFMSWYFLLCVFFFIPFCFYYYYSFNIFSHVFNFLVSPVKQFVTLVLKEQNRNISLILILSVLLLCKPVRLQFIGWLAALYYTTHANTSFLFSRRSFLLLFSLSGVKCSETQRLTVSMLSSQDVISPSVRQ